MMVNPDARLPIVRPPTPDENHDSLITLIRSATLSYQVRESELHFTASVAPRAPFSEVARNILGVGQKPVAAAALPVIQACGHMLEEFIVKSNGLTPEEFRKIKWHCFLNRNEWGSQSNPFIVAREESGLPRDLHIFPKGPGQVEVYVRLMQKGGIVIRGEKTVREITWILDVDTLKRKVLLENGAARLIDEADSISDRERAVINRYAGQNEFSPGRVFTYRHTGSTELRKGVLIKPCLLGNLLQYMPLSEMQILSFLPDIVRALAIMHHEKYIHLNVKPQSILLRFEEGRLRGKLGDFSFTQQVGELKSCPGTPGYNAPEIVDPKIDPKDIKRRADVWSLGLTLYDVRCGRYGQAALELGYTDDHLAPSRDLEAWKQKKLPQRATEGSLDWVIDQCLMMNSKQRIFMSDLLAVLKRHRPKTA